MARYTTWVAVSILTGNEENMIGKARCPSVDGSGTAERDESASFPANRDIAGSGLTAGRWPDRQQARGMRQDLSDPCREGQDTLSELTEAQVVSVCLG